MPRCGRGLSRESSCEEGAHHMTRSLIASQNITSTVQTTWAVP